MMDSFEKKNIINLEEERLFNNLTEKLMINEKELNKRLNYLTTSEGNTNTTLDNKITISLRYNDSPNSSVSGKINIEGIKKNIKTEKEFYKKPTNTDILKGLNDYLFELNNASHTESVNKFSYYFR